MDGLTTDSTGLHRLQFRLPNGRRGSMRLGRIPTKHAALIAHHVAEILVARRAGARLPEATALWLGGISRPLADKLTAKRIITPAMVQSQDDEFFTLGQLLDHFAESHAAHQKLNTRLQLGLTAKYLRMFFGDDQPLAAITPGDTEDFRAWLRRPNGKQKKALADNTVRRQCGRAKQIFRYAQRRRLIGENPFADMRGLQVMHNAKRGFHVERETIRRVLNACPSIEWQLLIVLGRFAGLRLPSEIVSLKWADVHWDECRIHVTSPKTEHHQGGEERDMPIFPDVYPTLKAAFDTAAEGQEYVIATPHYRQPKANLRTPLLRILRGAGVEPWPCLFQNLRASCEKELIDAGHAEWKVCRWIGHSEAVGRRHYRNMTAEDFTIASRPLPAEGGPARLRFGSAPARMEPHGAARPEAASDRKRAAPEKEADSRTKPSLVNARSVPRLGLEPRTL